MTIFEEAVEERGRIIRNASFLEPEMPLIRRPICRDEHIDIIAKKLSVVLRTGSSGSNLFIIGPPGTGKKYCVRWVLDELEQYIEKHKSPVKVVYVNAGKTRTSYFTLMKVLMGLGASVPESGYQNFRLKQAYQKIIENHQVIIAIDEFEVLIRKEKEPLVYYLSRQPNTTLILISNKWEDLFDLPEKARSSLMLDDLSFESYCEEEILRNLKEKVAEAFYTNVFSEEALNLIANVAFILKDLRIGIKLLYQLGEQIEGSGENYVDIDDVLDLVNRETKLKELEIKLDQIKRLKRRIRY